MDLRADIEALVDVLRRAPGSDTERRAAAYLKRRLEGLGREVEVESVDVWPAWPLAYAILAAAAVVGSVLSVSAPALGAGLALVAALLTFLDAGVLLPTVRRLLGRRASQNVVSWGDRDRPGMLLLVAHYDAGRGGIALGQKAEARRAAFGNLVRRPIGPLEPLLWAELAVLVCCVLRLASLSGLLLTVVQFIPTVLLIVAVALLLDIALSPTQPGENDNATGAALALRLAERFGGGRLEHFDVHVLFTGGQKALAAGSRSFLKRHKRELSRERTVVLNLDSVGSGTVRYTSREGPLLAIKSHPQLVQLCQAIAEDDEDENAFGARPIVNRSPSDGYAARSAGFPAITISCRGRLDYIPTRVDAEAIERAEAFSAELIRRLDAEVGPDLAAQSEETVLSEAED
ncbi:MAG TPA: M28 family peptidase [Thermoleophilaceae bacterium]|nr:M28 family peptidase [Thermoleophilaceae bacterium]